MKQRSTTMSNKPNSPVATIGIDIGKNAFHVVGIDRRGAIVLRQRWSRGQVQARLANMPPCLIGMEACVGAHHLSRRLQLQGHDARLMPASPIRRAEERLSRRRSNRRGGGAPDDEIRRHQDSRATRFAGAAPGTCAAGQPAHRIINQIRAFLLKRGIAVRQGLRFLRAELPIILATR
jgi:hypothetical protein